MDSISPKDKHGSYDKVVHIPMNRNSPPATSMDFRHQGIRRQFMERAPAIDGQPAATGH